jgi:hypothetical protein
MPPRISLEVMQLRLTGEVPRLPGVTTVDRLSPATRAAYDDIRGVNGQPHPDLLLS